MGFLKIIRWESAAKQTIKEEGDEVVHMEDYLMRLKIRLLAIYSSTQEVQRMKKHQSLEGLIMEKRHKRGRA